MSEDPLYIRILEKLGVNTTRLKWKLYQKERKVQDIARTGIRPKGLQWLSYPHKICSHCHAINDKEARECSSCNRRLPNMLIYKISRLLTSAASGESPVIIQGFLGLMLLFFAIEISFGGFSMENIAGQLRTTSPGGIHYPHFSRPVPVVSLDRVRTFTRRTDPHWLQRLCPLSDRSNNRIPDWPCTHARFDHGVATRCGAGLLPLVLRNKQN